MKLTRLARRSLRFYWRTHLGIALGVAVATAIIVGALLVGDSVRYSLRRLALARLGNVHLALVAHGRFFRAALADEIGAALAAETDDPAAARTAPVLRLRGSVANGEQRANAVQVLGVDDRFWQLVGGQATTATVVLNRKLALAIGAKVGDSVVMRVERPSLLSRDAVLSTTDQATAALRLEVGAIVDDDGPGGFSLGASQIGPLNAFVPLALLQEKAEQPGRANLMLIGAGGRQGRAEKALRQNWRLADAHLELQSVSGTGGFELRSNRVFLTEPVAAAAKQVHAGAVGLLTYFVNELRLGQRVTPYSMVTAVEASASQTLVPADMTAGEVRINEWLAEDLQAKAGDELIMTYYIDDPGPELVEASSSFRIRDVVKLEGAFADQQLMPAFPGLADEENCRDWQPGVPIKLDHIRDRDEAYWDAHRGTPKAFVTLAIGQRLWRTRFGRVTAIRYPSSAGGRPQIEDALRQVLEPAVLGLSLQPVRQQALDAGAQGTDFGVLFVSFSFFLIVAAALLIGLLFVFGVEQRATEVGTLLALGFEPRQVRRLLWLEGVGAALVGGVAGSVAGLVYTHVVLRLLATVWSTAVIDSVIRFQARPSTVLAGAAAGVLVALTSIWLTLRGQLRRPARELLARGAETAVGAAAGAKGRVGMVLAGLCLLGAAALLAGKGLSVGAFFGAGALLLVGGLALCLRLFERLATESDAVCLRLSVLGWRNLGRRRMRSLAIVAMLACGCFLVVAVGAFRHDPLQHAEERGSGTGGFALLGEATQGVHHNLNHKRGLAAYGLKPADLGGARLVQMRRREGDEASCLNLNRAQQPRLLGVDPDELRQRGAFTFVKTLDAAAKDDPWGALAWDGQGPAPAIADNNTIIYALGKKLGDELVFRDDAGGEFRVRLVGAMANSILQGSVIISEAAFMAKFPSASGYRVFLVDAEPAARQDVAQKLGRALQDAGLDLVPAHQRLAELLTVENSYINIFQALGGLGLVLGSVGLGLVVLRNILERRHELAVLRALGFDRRAVQWLVMAEHWLLLALGLALGLGAALVAVLPALLTPGSQMPWLSLGLTLAAVFLGGLAWVWLAARQALGGRLLAALRRE